MGTTGLSHLLRLTLIPDGLWGSSKKQYRKGQQLTGLITGKNDDDSWQVSLSAGGTGRIPVGKRVASLAIGQGEIKVKVVKVGDNGVVTLAFKGFVDHGIQRKVKPKALAVTNLFPSLVRGSVSAVKVVRISGMTAFVEVWSGKLASVQVPVGSVTVGQEINVMVCCERPLRLECIDELRLPSAKNKFQVPEYQEIIIDSAYTEMTHVFLYGTKGKVDRFEGTICRWEAKVVFLSQDFCRKICDSFVFPSGSVLLTPYFVAPDSFSESYGDLRVCIAPESLEQWRAAVPDLLERGIIKKVE